MRYYPIFVDLKGRRAIVIGGGPVAERKAESLLAAGARVTVVSPEMTERLEGLASKRRITAVRRAYEKDDLDGAFIVVCAAGSKAVNRAVYREASSRERLVNVVDEPSLCSFIVPSTVERGDLVIAISTSGKGPALSKAIRLRLEDEFGPEYETFVEILGRARNKLLKSGLDRVKKERVIKALAGSRMPGLIKGNKAADIDRLLADIAGRGYSLRSLGVKVRGRAAGRPARKDRGKGKK